MARGRKHTTNKSAKLPVKPPENLSKEESLAYGKIRDLVEATSGTGVAAADVFVVVSAACQLARVESLRKEAKLVPWTISAQGGSEKIHPIHQELRASELQLAGILGKICLTPRSRKGWRANPDPVGPSVDELESDPLLRILG
jgi:hypothetical protein